MIGLQSNKLIKQKERGCHMATKLYTIENLLIGKNYRSKNRHFEGEIVHAEKRPEIFYGNETEAYLIQVKTPSYLSDRYATVAVKVGE
jgi:hypothetical protein